MGILRSVTLDVAEDLFSSDVGSALRDDGVADLSDQDDKSGWSVVVLGVGPDQQDSVHDGHEVL